jgi:hypothetical protein
VIILFLALWGIDMWLMDRARLPYHSVLSIKSCTSLFRSCLSFLLNFYPFHTANTLTYILVFTISVIILYSIDITFLSNGLGWTIEQGIASFYFLFLIIYFIPHIPGEENKTAFNRLLKIVFFPGSSVTFPEVLLADALTSLSKVLKDFGTSVVSIYAAFSNQNILEYHNSAMVLVALLASLPFL